MPRLALLACAVLLLVQCGAGQWGAPPAPVRTAPLVGSTKNKAKASQAPARSKPGETQTAQRGSTSSSSLADAAGSTTLSERFDALDINKDGVIDRKEFSKLENAVGSNALSKALDDVANAAGVWEATGNSFVMIIATELGDKTFFLAAILAMRHSRFVVLAGAIGALSIMHVLSVVIGFALPALLPKAYTHYAAIAMFAYFGVRLLWESRTADSDSVEGLKEAEEELSSGKSEEKGDEETGTGTSASSHRATNGASSRAGENVITITAATVFLTTFTMTFLAEWGDRSQIATIAMGAAKNPVGVIIGGIIGHALCTGLAVLGGKFLATKISEKVVLLCGGVLFIAFAVHSVWVGP